VKIKSKMLISYMLIVALFIGIGAAITVNTMKMNDIQANVNKQVEIGNYATAYEKGFTLRSQGVGELASDPTSAITDTQTGQTLTAATATYLVDNLPAGSTLSTVFNTCNQIDSTIITPAVEKLVTAYSAQDIAEVAAQTKIITDAVREVTSNLDNFQLLIVENIQAATAEAASYASFSVMLSAVGITVIAAVSISSAFVMGKRMTDPLKKLTDIAGKVSMGELDHEIKINTKDEISELGEAFQRMINAFKMTTAMNQEEQA
jgi:nitrogen fixation/metabolism regulation signal transduction histidine kinase